jgi:hypothetical protein
MDFQGNILVHLLAIWYILRSLGTVFIHLVYFTVTVFIHFVYVVVFWYIFTPVLVRCTTKNLATLSTNRRRKFCRKQKQNVTPFYIKIGSKV